VPENYFDDFAHGMQHLISERIKQNKPSYLWLPKWVSAIVMLAVCVFIFWLAYAPQSIAPGNKFPLTNIIEKPVQDNKIDIQTLNENIDFDEDLLVSEAAGVQNQKNTDKAIENYILDNYNESQIIDEL
jgi:hypothetical protein